MNKEQAKQLARQVARSQQEGGTMHRPVDPNRPPKNLKAAQQEEMRQKMLEAAGKIAPSPDDAREQARRKKKKKSVGFAKGGKVRGAGCARRGHGRGTMR